MEVHERQLRTVVAAVATMVLSGCAATTTLKLDLDTCANVLVYPMFDVREDKAINIEDFCGENLKAHPVSDYYLGRNFRCIARFASDLGVVPNVSYADLRNGNAERLKALRTTGENYVLAIYLGELGYGAGNTLARASMEAFLVRVSTGRVIWSNAAKLTNWLGLLGTLSRAIGTGWSDPASVAYSEVLTKTMRGFPVLAVVKEVGGSP